MDNLYGGAEWYKWDGETGNEEALISTPWWDPPFTAAHQSLPSWLRWPRPWPPLALKQRWLFTFALAIAGTSICLKRVSKWGVCQLGATQHRMKETPSSSALLEVCRASPAARSLGSPSPLPSIPKAVLAWACLSHRAQAGWWGLTAR